ncbi:MAG: carboxypeptidase-like regulatory domain-containing protein [Bacteroides sp.]|nr:carboxypeptidase-like regulatory domain-containing protein [Bacteroides sp.]
MGSLFVYIVKWAVSLTLFYLFYRLLLSRETFHRFNRFALLGLLLLSGVLPLVQVSVTHPAEVHEGLLTLEQLLTMASAEHLSTADAPVAELPHLTWPLLLLLLYLGGMLLFLLHHLCSLTRLFLLLRRCTRESLPHDIAGGEHALLLVHERKLAPFSWMNCLVISRTDLQENGREIIIHELAHIGNRHSLDLLVADLCILLQWFNPAAWLLKQELQNIHEFEADESVIRRGTNVREYQLLLIKKAVGTRLYSMANSLNHSSLKIRITMMMKEKSNPWARMKYLYVLPVAAVAVSAFARPEVVEVSDEISAVKVNDLAAIMETKAEENAVPSAILSLHPADTVITQSDKVVVVSQERKRGKGDKKKRGKQQEESQTVTVVKNDGQKGRMVVRLTGASDAPQPLYVIDGVPVTQEIGQALAPSKIVQITVLKDSTAISAYGEKGKNGVILIQLKKEGEESEKTISIVKKVDDGQDNSQKVDGRDVRVIYLDGQEFKGKLNGIPADSIAAIRVDKKANTLYITTKQQEASLTDNRGITARAQLIEMDESNPLQAKGKVVDEEGNPVIGAVVTVKNSKKGTVTDLDGDFVVTLPSKESTVVISYIGMATIHVTQAGGKTMKVTLKKD